MLQVKKYYSDQRSVIGQTKFTYSSLGKADKKQIKTIKDHGKQLERILISTEIENHLKNQKNIYI